MHFDFHKMDLEHSMAEHMKDLRDPNAIGNILTEE